MATDANGRRADQRSTDARHPPKLNRRNVLLASTSLAAASIVGSGAPVASARAETTVGTTEPKLAQIFSTPARAQSAPASGKPNILVIMGDDIGWFNIGAYHRGMMSGKTPNLDKLAADGMIFTDYYAEASCTAGRANFITGQIPLRTGLTTVGQAGADVGMPDQCVTTALILRSMGYATGQFGKNHLGDLNKYLPTLHGFDEFFGYLYHLDAMSDPYWFDYPQDWIDKYGPRNLVHSYATDTDDATVMPRWGKVGKQRIVDEGPLKPFKDMSADHQMWQKGRDAKYDMETFEKFQFYQQPYGWPGEKVTTDVPAVVNLRWDPFERTPSMRGETTNDGAAGYMNDFVGREFWRFVQVQQTVAKAAQSLIDYPPMQPGASFNLQQVKEKVERLMKAHEGG